MRWIALPLAALLIAPSGASRMPRASRTPPTAIATFAGGCFWSMERPFDNTPGVISTTVGFAGGRTSDPSYEDVSTEKTGHAESVEVRYDPSRVTYDRLLDIYWHNVDPITRDAQFCDHGPSYRTVIFYHDDAQRAAAERSRAAVQRHFTQPVVTEIVPVGRFYKAEEYHQHFADRHKAQYDAYRRGCGRDARLKALWGDAAEPNVPPL